MLEGLLPPLLPFGFVVVIGLFVGSFLNVVIHRLPLMLENAWRQECQCILGLEAEHSEATPTYNLAWPPSHCPHCKAPVRFYQNIPIVSYLFLRGRCAHCATPISLRYPFVEALSGVLSGVVVWRFGLGAEAWFGLLLSWALIALAGIDLDKQLLPDAITLPMLWLGLLLSVFGVYTDSHASIIGAVSGYLSLWSLYWAFKLLTGKEGMGYGDFKLLAVFGAWFGWQCLPMVAFLSSLVGATVGIAMIMMKRLERQNPIPFGPYLAAAGWLAMLFGDGLNDWYLSWLTGH